MSLETVLTALQDTEQSPSATSLALLSALPDEDFPLFAETFSALSIQRRRDVIDTLAELAEDSVELSFDRVYWLGLDDSDVQVRAQSVKALYENEGSDLAHRLVAMLHDPEALVRGEAALALGLFLARAELEDKHDSVTSEIEEALRTLYYDESQIVEVRGRALEALGILSGEWVTDLINDAYGSGDRRFAISAVHAMGRNADPDWLPILFDEMVSEDAEMRFEAAQAAGELGDEEAIPNLSGMTADDDREVQEAAIIALGAIGGSTAKSVLSDLLSEYDDERVLAVVVEAMTTADFLEDPMALRAYLDGESADDQDEAEDEE